MLRLYGAGGMPLIGMGTLSLDADSGCLDAAPLPRERERRREQLSWLLSSLALTHASVGEAARALDWGFEPDRDVRAAAGYVGLKNLGAIPHDTTRTVQHHAAA